MTIAGILNRKGRQIVRVAPSDTVSTVIALLTEHRIGVVLVIARNVPHVGAGAHEVQGIVSERDIIRALAAVSRSGSAGEVLDMTASQIMTEARFTISASASVADAAALMTERRVRHLPVIENDRLVGLVSIGDVVKARLDQQEAEVSSLKDYVSGLS